MQFNPSNPQVVGMGAPAGMAAPGPIVSNNPYAPVQQPASGWQVPDAAHHHMDSGMNLGASAVNNFNASQPPADKGNLGNDEDEYAKVKLAIRIADTYPLHKGSCALAMKCVFSVTHFLTCLAFILSVFYKLQDGGFQFYWLMCSLFFAFVTTLFGLCHLDLAIMKKFLDVNPLLLNKWASLIVLGFLSFAYPYELNTEHMSRFIGSTVMFVVVAVVIVLLLYGIIGIFVCPRRQTMRSYV